MKKLLSYTLLILFFIIPVCNTAIASDTNYSIQYLENGDYIITEDLFSSNARTYTSPEKRSSYYTANHTLVFTTLLSATFNYIYGKQASAINSSITVSIPASSAIFKSKTSSVSGNTANGSATVFYQGADRTIYVSMTCDIYGNVR